MVLKYIISPYPSLVEDMVAKVYEASDDTAVIDSIPVPAPHTAPVTVTFNGLDKVVHIVRLFTASGTKLHEYNAEPVTDIVTVFDPIRFKIGDGGPNTPGINTDTYTNAALNGLDGNGYYVFRNNYGILFPGLHYTPDTDISHTGGFTLAGPDVFGDREEFTIMMNNKVSTSTVNDSVVGKWVAGVVDINANRSYLATDLRKLIRLIGAVTYEFTGSIPIGYGFLFQNFSATNATATVKFSNAQLRYGDDLLTTLDIPRFGAACFIFDGTIWNVVYFAQASLVSTTPKPGQTIGVGTILLGNVPVGDFSVAVTHGLSIAGDYLVFLSCKGAASTIGKDDDLQLAWYHHPTDQPNKFMLGYGIPNGSVGHNITVCYLIVKI